MEYFVAGNLEHDGKAYKRGDTISFSDADGAPQHLLAGGVIQTEPIADAPAREAAPAAEQPAQPEISGKPMETGEPSIDGRAPERQVDNATDVTPPVDTGMRALSPDVRAGNDMAPTAGSEVPVEPTEAMSRAELEELAAKEGMTEAEATEAPNKGALIDSILEHRKGASAQPAQPDNDPSAGL